MKSNILCKFAYVKDMIGIDKTAAAQMHRMIMESSVVTLVSHTHADGDAIGSTTALSAWLRAAGKDAVTILPEEIDDNLRFMVSGSAVPPLAYTADKEAADRRIATSDLIICLDFNAFSRAAAMENTLREAGCRKILIDHHIGPDTASFDIVFSECAISSTCELLFWILMEMPEICGDASRLPMESLTALTTGMTTDTNNFANSVYPSTFRMASAVLEAGVDRNAILLNLYNMYRENRLRLMGEMLKDRMTITADGVAYMIMDNALMEKYGFREGESEGFVNMPLTIAGVRMSILLKADKTFWRVSIRSKSGTSANMCARLHFNGGGHEQAAGGRLFYDAAGSTATKAAAYIEKVTNEFFEKK